MGKKPKQFRLIGVVRAYYRPQATLQSQGPTAVAAALGRSLADELLNGLRNALVNSMVPRRHRVRIQTVERGA